MKIEPKFSYILLKYYMYILYNSAHLEGQLLGDLRKLICKKLLYLVSLWYDEQLKFVAHVHFFALVAAFLAAAFLAANLALFSYNCFPLLMTF